MDIPGEPPLTDLFPNLKSFDETSDHTVDYNCIAWAAGDTENFWWPDDEGDGYWPDGVTRDLSSQSAIKAFETRGYQSCPDGSLEEGFEKVAIYLKKDKLAHASRQLPNGMWTSKMGCRIDMSHGAPECLNGDIYGEAKEYMRRAREV